VPIALPSGQVAGVIDVVLPTGWTLTGSAVDGLLRSHGATAAGYRWVIVAGSGVTLELSGPNTPSALLTGTVRTLVGSSPISIFLT
jgi:hypothetical protein